MKSFSNFSEFAVGILTRPAEQPKDGKFLATSNAVPQESSRRFRLTRACSIRGQHHDQGAEVELTHTEFMALRMARLGSVNWEDGI